MNRNVLASWLLYGFLVSPWTWVAAADPLSPDWQHWSDGQFPRAEEEGKLVLLDLSAEWCAFCKQMDATTYQDPKVLALIEQYYIPVRIEDEKHPELAARFREIGRPGTLVYDGEGNELVIKKGYIKPQWMEWMLQALVQENL
jgi:thiol:disulfide interchange protein